MISIVYLLVPTPPHFGCHMWMVLQAKDGTTALDLAEKELQRYIDLHPDEEPTQKFNDIIDIVDMIKERMSGETRAERLNGISTC